MAAFRTSQSRRAADITIALKHRTESQEMISTHERWSHFSRGPEIARLDLLRTLDDAVAADREILRIVTQELRDTLRAREAVGAIVDHEVQKRAEALVAPPPPPPAESRRAVASRARRAGSGAGGWLHVLQRAAWALVVLLAVAWAVRGFVL